MVGSGVVNMTRLVGLLVVLAGGLVVMAIVGFDFGQGDSTGTPKGEKVPFAIDRVAGEGDKSATFDGKRAMKYLEQICAIGPRMSGTPGMRQQQELIRKHFEGLKGKVEAQTFSAKQVSRAEPVEMTNLIVSWHPDRKRRVILCSHYDTRPIADQEPDPRKWREKFVSANDGGSGVAFLMELGHQMKDLNPQVGVDFVFFDGEEYIWEPKRDKYFLGSEHFAQSWKKSKPRVDYAAAILLDMIAGKNARFPVEGHSWQQAQALVLDIWRIARDQRCRAFLEEVGDRVEDDHLSLLKVGIPAIDIIDFDYPHWHRLSDTPENCSREGMEQVARVLAVWLQRVK
jgi:glutaminyl-peptide cyclotransferase